MAFFRAPFISIIQTLGVPEPAEIYVAYPIDSSVVLGAGSSGVPIRMLGRLSEGVTRAQAETELRSVGHELAREYPAVYRDREGKPSQLTFNVLALREAIVGAQHSLLWLLLARAAILLLVTCANTAQLLLARSLRREREIAVRAALGARRTRLVQQFLVEGIVLAVCGGGAGLLAAGWVARILVAVLPERSPLLEGAHTDVRVVAAGFGVSLISAMAFAIVPALKSSQWTPGMALTPHAAASEGNWWRHAMVAIEGALSVFLLCGAGLVAENLWTFISTTTGFNANNVLAMQIRLASLQPSGPTTPRAGQAFEEYIEKVEAIPGVDSAATVTGPPLRPARSGPSELARVTNESGALKSIGGDNHLVSADYFRTLRIPVLAGRTFRTDDAVGRSRVAIVNEEFARRFGLGRDVVGRQIFEPGDRITIVGMVGNVRTRGLQTAPVPEVYISSLQLSWANTYLVVRSAIPPGEPVRLLKSAIESANSDQAVFGVQTMNKLLDDSVTEPKFDVFLIGTFCGAGGGDGGCRRV